VSRRIVFPISVALVVWKEVLRLASSGAPEVVEGTGAGTLQLIKEFEEFKL
jgi:hypothetical protein